MAMGDADVVISSPTGSRLTCRPSRSSSTIPFELENGMNNASPWVTNGCEKILPGSRRFQERVPAEENL